jgi:hypothetical protein
LCHVEYDKIDNTDITPKESRVIELAPSDKNIQHLQQRLAAAATATSPPDCG